MLCLVKDWTRGASGSRDWGEGWGSEQSGGRASASHRCFLSSHVPKLPPWGPREALPWTPPPGLVLAPPVPHTLSPRPRPPRHPGNDFVVCGDHV